MADTLRLIFPEWQGAYAPVVSQKVPELDYEQGAMGDMIGARILNMFAPKTSGPTAEVPVAPYNKDDIATEKGIFARQACLRNLKSAIKIIKDHNPSKICTIGGDCSTSIPSFSYLADKYKEDLAIVWFDGHPDISIPGDEYPGYHAMALSHVFGLGDEEFLQNLPGRVKPSKAIIVGIRSMEPEAADRKEEIGLKGISPQELRSNPQELINWLKKTGAKKVCIHLDLDCLDPKVIRTASWQDPDGLLVEEVVDNIKAVSEVCEVVGMTIAEHVPIVQIRLGMMMNSLPLFK